MGINLGGGNAGKVIGGAAGGVYGAAAGYAYDKMGGSKGVSGKFRSINPFDTSKSNDLAKKGEHLADEQYGASHDVSEQMGAADDEYGHQYAKASNQYQGRQGTLNNDYEYRLGKLDDEAKQQSSDARKTYADIQPRLKGAMEDADTQQKDAMSLKDAGDPNNSVQTAVRAMYDKQAQGAQKQGMADFGTMSALGAQAAGQQFGSGVPMTSGAMGQIYAQNQSQAGNAYAAAQQRMHGLQQQGIDRGFDESSKQYDRGQAAKDRYRQSIGDVSSAESDYQRRSRDFRDERGGYAGEKYGIESNSNADRFNMANQSAGIDQQAAYGRGERDLAALGQKYGYQQQGVTNRINVEEGARAGKIQTLNKEQENGGKVMSSAGSFAGAASSDERVKHGIKPVKDEDLDEFFGAVDPKSYSYDEPDAPGRAPGRRIGFMLQDVEDTKLGKQIMRKGPDGTKMYDKDNLNGIIMAGLARQARKSA